jgi:hypothetical protein
MSGGLFAAFRVGLLLVCGQKGRFTSINVSFLGVTGENSFPSGTLSGDLFYYVDWEN